MNKQDDKVKFRYTFTGDDKSLAVLDRDLFSLSEIFHENTKERRITPRTYDTSLDAIMSLSFKEYKNARRLALERHTSSGRQFDTVMLSRRSSREFGEFPLSKEDISYLLEYTYLAAEKESKEFPGYYRPAPSAGALYPLELYPIVFNIREVPQGIYHYHSPTHSLELLEEGSFSDCIANICLSQDFIRFAGVCIAVTAVFGRTQFKYGDRGYRYVLLDAGHLVQNVYLAATALELAVCSIGGFFDDEFNELLGIDGVTEAVVYAVVIGSPAGQNTQPSREE
jgi:SagB-type dehydrogenase family enzyme